MCVCVRGEGEGEKKHDSGMSNFTEGQLDASASSRPPGIRRIWCLDKLSGCFFRTFLRAKPLAVVQVGLRQVELDRLLASLSAANDVARAFSVWSPALPSPSSSLPSPLLQKTKHTMERDVHTNSDAVVMQRLRSVSWREGLQDGGGLRCRKQSAFCAFKMWISQRQKRLFRDTCEICRCRCGDQLWRKVLLPP